MYYPSEVRACLRVCVYAAVKVLAGLRKTKWAPKCYQRRLGCRHYLAAGCEGGGGGGRNPEKHPHSRVSAQGEARPWGALHFPGKDAPAAPAPQIKKDFKALLRFLVRRGEAGGGKG